MLYFFAAVLLLLAVVGFLKVWKFKWADIADFLDPLQIWETPNKATTVIRLQMHRHSSQSSVFVVTSPDMEEVYAIGSTPESAYERAELVAEKRRRVQGLGDAEYTTEWTP